MGKSHFIRVAAITIALGAPGSTTVIVRKELKALKANHMQGNTSLPALLAPLIRRRVVKVDNSNNIIRIKNGGPNENQWEGGSSIVLIHLQRGDASLEAVQGMEITGALLVDESTHLSAHQINYLRSRVRLGGWRPKEGSIFEGSLPRIVYATNPGSTSMTWHKNTFTYLEPYVVHPGENEDMFAKMFIPCLCVDNPYITQNYIETLKQIENPDERKALLYGSWDISSGTLFGDSLRKDLHVLDSIELPQGSRITRSLDFGASAPTAIEYAYICEDDESLLVNNEYRTFPRGTTFIIDEMYLCDPDDPAKGINIEDTEIGRRMYEFEKAAFAGYKIVQGVADGAIFNRDNNRKTIVEDINKGYYGREVNNLEILFKPYWKPAGSRELGARKINSMLLAVHKGNKMEDPGLFFLKNCKYTYMLLDTLPKDPAKFDCVKGSNDHIFDSIRYLLLTKVKTIKTIQASVF